MAKKIKDPNVFDVNKYTKQTTHGPKKRAKNKTMTQQVQLKFPWYNEKI